MQVLCGQCGNTIEVDKKKAGEKIICPHCQHTIVLPGSSVAALSAGDDEPGFAEKARETMESKVHVDCGACGRGLKVPFRMLGKKMSCPSCGKTIRVPYPEDELPDIKPFRRRASRTRKAKDTLTSSAGAAQEDIEVSQPAQDVAMKQNGASEGSVEMLDLVDAVERSGVRNRRRRKKKTASRVPWFVFVLAILLVAGVVWLLRMHWMRKLDEMPIAPEGDRTSEVNTAYGRPVTARVQASEKKRATVEQIIEPVRTYAIRSISDCLYADGKAVQMGYFVCRLQVRFHAGRDGVVLPVGLGNVSLLVNKVPYNAIESPEVIRIPSNTTRDVELQFVLPLSLAGTPGLVGDLVIGKAAPKRVVLGNLQHVRLADGQDGLFVEQAPRFLPTEHVDEVVAAIAAEKKLELLVRARPDRAKSLTFGQGKVRATAYQEKEDSFSYICMVDYQKLRTQATLRFAHGGKLAILYFSDAPDDQLVFVLSGWKPRVYVVDQAVNDKPAAKTSTQPSDSSQPAGTPAKQPRFFGL